MKEFVGTRDANGARVSVNGRALDPRLHIRNHSPDGFNWGYGGSGPAQLALAMLAEVAGDQVAERWYQEFKFAKLCNLAESTWRITDAEIMAWLRERDALLEDSDDAEI